MKELFVEKDEEEATGVKETGKIKVLKGWWIGRKCSFCGSDQKLWVQPNGMIRCEKHYISGGK